MTAWKKTRTSIIAIWIDSWKDSQGEITSRTRLKNFARHFHPTSGKKELT
ncbi:hypothetical protein [uncultured Treponema sp.]|nr:hypothetical protein [uncultured Treponema sp.]